MRLVEQGGQGVLVPSAFILSATHCIDWCGTGMMALGEVYPVEIETASGVKFRVGVDACDPVSDMAALGELDNQTCPDDADRFEEWREKIERVALSDRHIKPGESCPAFIYTHKGEWIKGSVTHYDRDIPHSSLALFTDVNLCRL